MQIQFNLVVNAMKMEKENIIKIDTRGSEGLASPFYFFHYMDVEKPQSEALSMRDIKPVLNFLNFKTEELSELLEVDASTLSRWRKQNKPIGKLRTKVAMDLDRIIAKGIRIFGSEENFKNWLSSENAALGNVKPIHLMDDAHQYHRVDDALEAISWGNIM